MALWDHRGEKSGDSKKVVNVNSNLRIATFFPPNHKLLCHPEAPARDLPVLVKFLLMFVDIIVNYLSIAVGFSL